MDTGIQYYVFNLNRIAIFLLIIISIIDDNNYCSIIAAAYWLWLPNIEKIEYKIMKFKIYKGKVKK